MSYSNFSVLCDSDTLSKAVSELSGFLSVCGLDKTDSKTEEGIVFKLSVNILGRAAGSYSIQNMTECILLEGEDAPGVLYAVYEMLEMLGFGFYPDKISQPRVPRWDALKTLPLKRSPNIPLRGMFVIPWFDDLSMLGIYWGYREWDRLIDWMAQQRMNLLRLHLFPSMGFFPLERYPDCRPANQRTKGRVRMMRRVTERAKERGIKISLSFYPNAVTQEFADIYPDISYNARYTYFTCLDSETGWDYAMYNVREMIDAYHPDFIELVTTEVHCPICGKEKFSSSQIKLFRELISYIKSTDSIVAIFPFVFPLGYTKLAELLNLPSDTIIYTEDPNLRNTARYKAGGHYIACFEQNSAPLIRFKISEVGLYAKKFAEHGTALTYYLTGFTTKGFEITMNAAAKQFWDPYMFDKRKFFLRTASDRFSDSAEINTLIAEALTKFDDAWERIESITLGNNERINGFMPSVVKSNYQTFLSTYADLILAKKEYIMDGLRLAQQSISLLQRAKLLLRKPADLIQKLELGQYLLYLHYFALLQSSEGYVLHRKALLNDKGDMWAKHSESLALSNEALTWIEGAVLSLKELVWRFSQDEDYADIEPHMHPYQPKGLSPFIYHSGFTQNVMKMRLTSMEALLDEVKAMRDKQALEGIFQGEHRPFVIPNLFQA
ncbi:MAG: hypothetical protein LBS84_01675 [Clostridiales bacterium]|jgi:hypothetical protein|nr:hypothetical protein [Clostridiales bacterium]